MKLCRKCNLEKEPAAFYKDTSRTSGLSAYCQECDKTSSRERARLLRATVEGKQRLAASSRKYLYGLSDEEYRSVFKLQQGLCAVCQQSQGGRALSVDHDHQTGVVRGLLCDSCNIGIGSFKDDPFRLRAAAYYLEKRGSD